MLWGGENLHILVLIKTSLRSPQEAKECKDNDTSTSPSFCSPDSDSSGGQSYHCLQSLSLESAFIIHLPGATLSHKDSVSPPEHSGEVASPGRCCPCTGHQCYPRPLSASKSAFSGTAEWQERQGYSTLLICLLNHASSEALVLHGQD